MKIFSLAHLNHLARRLPDPAAAVHPVLRLAIEEWDAIDDAEHPAGEFEAHTDPYIEFEIVQWQNSRGISSPRWVLRGLVAM
jgi:hypothetical protein